MNINDDPQPPALALRFLRWFCPPALLESIEGDLMQAFDTDFENHGARTAARNFNWNVIRFFRPGIFLRNKFNFQPTNTIMFGNYMKVAARNIGKRKLYSFINAFGLSIAIAFCVLIYLYIQDEKSFDTFHQEPERVFMLTEKSFSRDAYEKGEKEVYGYSAYLPAKLAEVMLDEMPEVEAVTRTADGEGVMRYNDRIFKQTTQFVDSGFFNVFSFRILSGSVNRIFRNGNEAVLTPAVAEKFFGTEDPIGKTFSFDSNGDKIYSVAAIIEAPPANSSIDFAMLLPIASRPFFAHNRESWGAFSYPTFVRIHKGVNTATFAGNLSKLVDKYLGEKFAQWRERWDIPDGYAVAEFGFTNILDVHLNTRISWTRVSDPQYAYVLASIALLILIIACINYISLALTTSASRRVEVGVRKVVGADKAQLVYQFGFESIILALISMIIGVILVLVFLPAFNEFTQKGISLSFANLAQLLAVSLVFTIVIGVIAGSYPSLFLSGFRPVQVLKGRFTARLQAGFTRPLVVVQFALSAFLIISSLIMYRQMRYVTTKDLGYSKDQVVIVPTQAGFGEASDRAVTRMRDRLKNEPGIAGVAGTTSSFNQGWSRYGYKIGEESKAAYVYAVDPYYIPLLSLTLEHGRNFDERIASDSSAIIVNEALVRDMGWKDPLNEYLNWREDTVGLGSPVIGVLKDYHFLSLEQEISPMFLSMDKKNIGNLTTMMIKISGDDVPNNLDRLGKIWRELTPDKPFDYTFLDEDVARQYERYNRWMKVAGLSTAFAILIASLGLFGLAGVNAINKTKEIGIRKVMGAGIGNIFVLLNRQYVWLATIAFAIASPFSWYVMNKWIAEFQFRIAIGWELFAISMIGGLMIALLTVSYHAIKAALINPAETLKYE